MKTIGVFLLLVAVANAYSIEALKKIMREITRSESRDSSKSMTLKEYLDNLETPDPSYKSSAKRLMSRRTADCSASCGEAPQLDVSIECESGKWRPEYEVNGECECLARYRCCEESCPVADLQSCWGENNANKGFLYGVKEIDCCGCEAVKCVKCEEPASEEETCPRNEGARPTDCYAYTKNDHFANDTRKCYRSGCVENASDAPKDAECDSRCEKDGAATSHCQFPYKICQPSIAKEDCPRISMQTASDNLELVRSCYHLPTQVIDEDGGHYFEQEAGKCAKCLKWDYAAKSCEAKNEAAALADCHQFGANKMDKKCFLKIMKQDECKCDSADCVANPVEEADELPADEVCPNNHVRISGVSICMKPRDLCKQCSVPIKIDPSDCPVGKVLLEDDCNKCPIYVCQPPAIDPDCGCGSFNYDKETNTMKCMC